MQAPTAASESTVTLTPAPTSAPEPSPEAPSTPATPEAAAKSGDAKAFREMRHQERVDALTGTKKVTVKEHERTVPAKPEGEKPAERKPKNIDTRQQQLDSEIAAKKAELQERLRIRAELDKQLKALDLPTKAEPKVEKPAPKKSNWADHPDAPKLEDFPDYETYLDARAEFIADRKYEARMSERDQRTAQEREIAQRVEGVTTQAQTFKERVLAYQKEKPDAQFAPQLLEIMPLSAVQAMNAQVPADQQQPIGAEHFIIEQVFRSEMPGALLAHFSSSPGEFQRLYTLAFTDPQAVVRAIGALEARLSSSASPAPSPSARMSTIPNPPTVLGGKAAVLDPMKQAVKAGDVRAYKQLRHQERMAAFGRR